MGPVMYFGTGKPILEGDSPDPKLLIPGSPLNLCIELNVVF